MLSRLWIVRKSKTIPLIERPAQRRQDKADMVKTRRPGTELTQTSVSAPSWLFGKICRSKRPLVSVLIAAAFLGGMFRGCESGRLLAICR